jgi:hypothetical protein
MELWSDVDRMHILSIGQGALLSTTYEYEINGDKMTLSNDVGGFVLERDTDGASTQTSPGSNWHCSNVSCKAGAVISDAETLNEEVTTPATGGGSANLPQAGGGCEWRGGVTPSVIELRADIHANSQLLTSIPANSNIDYEHCSGRGWVRDAYQGTVGWARNDNLWYG